MMPSDFAIKKEMEATGFTYLQCCRRIKDRRHIERKESDRRRRAWA